jgi:hypothetical protein
MGSISNDKGSPLEGGPPFFNKGGTRQLADAPLITHQENNIVL